MVRRLEAAGVPIAGLVVGFALLFTVLWAALRVAAGGAEGGGPLRLPWWGADSWSEAMLRGMVLAYTPALMAFGRRGARRDVAALEKAGLAAPHGADALASGILAMPRRTMRAAGVAGLLSLPLLTLLIPLLAGGGPGYEPTGGAGSWSGIYFPYSAVYFLAAGWALGRALVHDVLVARAFSRIGASSALPFDLLDPSSFRPLTRYGLRTVLLWVGWFVLISLFWIGPGMSNPANALAIVPLLGVTAVAFVLPVWGAHGRLRDARRAELQRVDAALREARGALFSPGASDPRIANLVGWRIRVEAVREWPFDAPTMLRFLAFLALGVGSWLGGALAERFLDVFMAAG